MASRGGVGRPLPFRKPVSAAFTLAFKLHHASATLRANQVDDRGNYAGVKFPWHRLERSHRCSPLFCRMPSLGKNSSLQLCEAQPRTAYDGSLPRGVCRSQAPGWLAAEFVWSLVLAAASLSKEYASSMPIPNSE
jgi:hypothetical protein